MNANNLSNEDFINKAKSIHGDKYDYSNTVYINSKSTVIINCKTHGDFCQTANSHIAGCGCRKCGIESVSKIIKGRMTRKFIDTCKRKHGNKYDYSKTKYTRAEDNVIITCKKHGDFFQKAASHIKGCGCQMCAKELYLYTKNDFLKDSKIIHGEKYKYELNDFKNKHEKIKIICPYHGDFFQTPYKHIKRKQGCSKCGNNSVSLKAKIPINVYIDKANKRHNRFYDYSKSVCLTAEEKTEIICPVHGSFYQTMRAHLRGNGCPKCKGKKISKKLISNTEAFIKKAKFLHNDRYDYSLVLYAGNKNPVKIICKKHGIFNQTPNVHLHPVGCPICSISKLEISTSRAIEGLGLLKTREKVFNNLFNINKLRLDFYLTDINTAIECHGEQHFKNKEFFNDRLVTVRDCIKYIYCFKNKIKLIIIADHKHIPVLYFDFCTFMGFDIIPLTNYNNTELSVSEIKKSLTGILHLQNTITKCPE